MREQAKAIPETRHLALEIEQAIAAGVYPPGTMLPSMRELAAQYRVGLSSAHGAYQLLEKKKLVAREPGRGTFVTGNAHPTPEPGLRIYSWDERMFETELIRLFSGKGHVLEYEWGDYGKYLAYIDFLKEKTLRYPGLVVLNAALLPVMAEEGILECLDDLPADGKTTELLESFPAGCRRAMCRNGRTYGLPLNCLPTMAYFNKRIFREAGVPLPEPDWSWDDIFALLDALTRVSPEGRLSRGAIGLLLDSNGYMPILARYGGEIFDHAGNCAVATAAFAAGIEDFLKFYSHPGCIVHKFGEPRDALARLAIVGRIGMVIGNEYDGGIIRRELPPEDFMELCLPGGATGHSSPLIVRGVGILKGAADPAGLFRELEQILYRPETLDQLALASGTVPLGPRHISRETARARDQGRPEFQHPGREAFRAVNELLMQPLIHRLSPTFPELREIEKEINRRIQNTTKA